MRKPHSSKEKIEAWLSKQIIQGQYVIHDDLSVDIQGSIIVQTHSKYLPVNFSLITDSLTLMRLPLVSLEGCPVKPIANFLVSDTLIEDLSYAPMATLSFASHHNHKLTSLKGAPEQVRSFSCVDCPLLTSLKFGPQVVLKDYAVMRNNITSLEGIAQTIGRNLNLNQNPLTNFDFEPKTVGGHIDISQTNIQALQSLPQNTQFQGHLLSNHEFLELKAYYQSEKKLSRISHTQLKIAQEKLFLEQQFSPQHAFSHKAQYKI